MDIFIMDTFVPQFIAHGANNGRATNKLSIRMGNIYWKRLTNWGIVTHFMKEFFRKKMHLKMLSAKWYPFCSGLNVSTLRGTKLWCR